MTDREVNADRRGMADNYVAITVRGAMENSDVSAPEILETPKRAGPLAPRGDFLGLFGGGTSLK